MNIKETPEMKVEDPGIDEPCSKLTPDQIEKVVNHVFTKEASARLKVYIDTCVHCGLCAEACHTYISRNKDPQGRCGHYYLPLYMHEQIQTMVK